MDLPKLPKRDPKGHKGTFGTVVVVGGCAAGKTRMIGAPALSALAALRSGAGLAKVVVPRPIVNEVVALTPSATGIALEVDGDGRVETSPAVQVLDEVVESSRAIAIGAGLGRAPEAGGGPAAMVLRLVQQEQTPLVIDADAIVALGEIADLHRDFRAPAVLTPHPGEFKTLASKLRISLDPIDPDTRPAAAEAMAQKIGCIVVLKGSGTVVTDGQRTWVCEEGDAVLATAGTGDVLTGLLAGLMAQFVRVGPFTTGAGLDLFDAARLGVLAHARAAARWSKARGVKMGMLASELADEVPAAMASLG